MNLSVASETFLRHAFPSMRRILHKPDTDYETNNVMLQVCVQYGHMGSGKTETIRKLAEIAVDYYGEDNVNAVMSRKANLNRLMNRGLNSKLIQILAVDDATRKRFEDRDLERFFGLRHIYRRQTGNTNGYILVIFNVHRFHGLQTDLRTNVDLGIWRTPPTNPYDQSVVRKFVGNDGMQDLRYVEEQRLEDPEWNAVSVFTTRTRKGLLVFPHAKINHLRVIEDTPRTLQEPIKSLTVNEVANLLTRLKRQ